MVPREATIRKKTIKLLHELADLIVPLPMPTSAANHYGEIRNALAAKGKLIGNNDLLIAAHALSLGVVLVTNNIKEFSRVPKLKVENWVD